MLDSEKSELKVRWVRRDCKWNPSKIVQSNLSKESRNSWNV